MIATNQQQQAVGTSMTKAQSTLSQTMRIAVLLLLTALSSSAASFQMGGSRPLATRSRRRISTMFYANSAEDRWIASSSNNNRHSDNAAAPESSTSRDATKPTEGGPGEEAVDEYLEFLAKRYRRLHEDEAVSAPGVFSTWKWLGLGSSGDANTAAAHPTGNTQLQEENALYALGVAGLASKKLLQKHRVSSEKLRAAAVAESDGEDAAASIIDCDATTTSTTIEKEQSKQSALIERARRVVDSVGAARRALHEYQDEKLRTAARVVTRAPIARLGRKLFALGGGQATVGLTATVAVALVLVLVKPAAHFVANESVNMTRGA